MSNQLASFRELSDAIATLQATVAALASGSGSVYRGAWSSGNTYIQGDLVVGSDSELYVSLSNGNIGHDPTTDAHVHWSATPPTGGSSSYPKSFARTLDMPSIASVGTWLVSLNSAMIHSVQRWNSSIAQNDSITFIVDMAAGTWNLNLTTYQAGYCAKATVDFSTNGGTTWTNAGTVDTYAAASAAIVLPLNGVVIPTGGPVLWRFTAATRNPSATNWYLLLSAFSGVCTT